MSDDDRKKQVQQRIAKDVTPLVKIAVAAADVAIKDLKGSIADVDAALKDTPDVRIMETVERELSIDSREGGKAALKFKPALDAIAQATEDDDDFKADQDEIKAIKKLLALRLQALKETLADADKRKQAIDKWNVEATKDDKAALQTWVMDGDLMASDESDFNKAMKAVDAWVADAEKAVKGKDAAALKKLQAKPPELDVKEIKEGKYSAKYTNAFAKRFTVTSLGKELQTRVAKDTVSFKAADKRLQKIAVDYAAAKVKVAKLK